MSVWTCGERISGARIPSLRPVFAGLAALLLFGAVAGAACAQPIATSDPADLVALLKRGGLILYVRHAATNLEQADQDVTDLTRCDLQRNLSDQGRQESRTMASAISRFEIPIGQVLSSPYCRTIDTAEIVFGRYEIVDDLRATFFANEAETERINQVLHGLLGQPPGAGLNTVIVGHTANLDDVTSIWPEPEGVAHVFRPLGSDGFEHLGWIEPSDWADLLAAE